MQKARGRGRKGWIKKSWKRRVYRRMQILKELREILRMFREDYSRGEIDVQKKKTETEDLFRTRSRILKTRKISRRFLERLKNLPGKRAEKNSRTVKIEILEEEEKKKREEKNLRVISLRKLQKKRNQDRDAGIAGGESVKKLSHRFDFIRNPL